MSGNFRSDGTISAAGRGQVCVSTADKNAQFRKLRQLRENSICFDCSNTRPTWASCTYGMYEDLLTCFENWFTPNYVVRSL
mmetsp:Transcript_23920/g.36879  ORF Transcript_23920/g.36879 Transcript_23920/m.36879 type:complete len:81 (+) Transcript_23920:132-374(+)